MKKHLTKTRIAVYVTLLCALGVITVPATYARYMSQVNGSAVASAAVWGSDSSAFKIDVSGLLPGELKTYTFNVTNTKDGKTSQVGQDYSVTVETTGNLPLEFALIPDSMSGGGNYITAQAGSNLVFTEGKSTAEGGFLPHSTAAIHTYRLKVSWPESVNSGSAYADEIDLVTVTVDAKQVLPDGQG